MENKRSSRQHEVLRVPQGWNGQSKGLIVQMERILDDIYNQLVRGVKSILGIKPDKNGNVQLTRESLSGLVPEVVDSLDDTSADKALSANQGSILGKRALRIGMAIGDSYRLTGPSRCAFLMTVCGGTNTSHRGAYLCFVGADAETYQVEPLVTASSVTVTASASGITVENATVYKYLEVLCANADGITATKLN